MFGRRRHIVACQSNAEDHVCSECIDDKSDWCQSGIQNCRDDAIAANPRRYKDSTGAIFNGPGFEYKSPANSDTVFQLSVEGPYTVSSDPRYTAYFWKNYTVRAARLKRAAASYMRLYHLAKCVVCDPEGLKGSLLG